MCNGCFYSRHRRGAGAGERIKSSDNLLQQLQICLPPTNTFGTSGKYIYMCAHNLDIYVHSVIKTGTFYNLYILHILHILQTRESSSDNLLQQLQAELRLCQLYMEPASSSSSQLRPSSKISCVKKTPKNQSTLKVKTNSQKNKTFSSKISVDVYVLEIQGLNLNRPKNAKK